MDRFESLRSKPAYGALTPAGRELLETALKNAPVRTVGRRSLLSVSGTHISSKFSLPTHYESRGCEKAYVLLAAQDPRVLEVFAQPAQLAILEHDRLGRRRPVRRTPDYLECHDDVFALVECKPREELEKLALKTKDWVRDKSGRWQFRPGEEAATRLGMAFRVFCPDDYPPALLTNLEIATRFGDGLLPPSAALLRRVRIHLNRNPQTVTQLCERYAGLTGGRLWAAIQCGQLFGFLDRQLFDTNFLIYSSEPTETYRTEGQENRSLGVEPGPLATRLATASNSELTKAKEACKQFDGRRLQSLPLNATDYRYKKKLDAAQAEGAPRLAAFVPRFKDRGGDGPRISQ